jgi:hypothetical protein
MAISLFIAATFSQQLNNLDSIVIATIITMPTIIDITITTIAATIVTKVAAIIVIIRRAFLFLNSP